MGAEEIIAFLTGIQPGYVYLAVFLISYIENIFPPFPSDVIVVFAGSLVALGQGNELVTVMLATLGSTLGFMSMYWIGDKVGDNVLEKGKIRFISPELVKKVDRWFDRYGYWVIAGNRFLAGTRAVVSFCAGLAEMKFLPTVLLSAVSAMAWNFILVSCGVSLGRNWREIGSYLTTYSMVISLVILGAALAWIILSLVKSHKNAR